MYDPNYYCDGCGKRLGQKSHEVEDRLGEAYYENQHCQKCELAELKVSDYCDDGE